MEEGVRVLEEIEAIGTGTEAGVVIAVKAEEGEREGELGVLSAANILAISGCGGWYAGMTVFSMFLCSEG